MWMNALRARNRDKTSLVKRELGSVNTILENDAPSDLESLLHQRLAGTNILAVAGYALLIAHQLAYSAGCHGMTQKGSATLSGVPR